MIDVLTNATTDGEGGSYIDSVRSHFFPMLSLPSEARLFSLPTDEEFRAILYSNEVGYKRVNGKLYVRRYYRIPMLLFPTAVKRLEQIEIDRRIRSFRDIDDTSRTTPTRTRVRLRHVQVTFDTVLIFGIYCFFYL